MGGEASAAGAAFLSAVPSLGAATGAFGQMALSAGDIGGILAGISPVGLAGLAAAAVAAAAAFAFLHDDASAATDALNAQKSANDAVAASHRAVTDAVYAHKAAQDALSGASISREQSLLDLERANRRVAFLEKNGVKTSIEYRQALLDQRRAQDAVRSSRTDLIRQGEEAIRQTRQTRAEIDREVRSTQEAADAARKRQVGIRSGLIAGRDAAAASKEIDKALRAEARASAAAAAKHRDNAQRAQEMANAIGGATPRAKALRDRLRELARQELNLASAIAAMNALKAAASSAAAGVQHVYNLIQNPPAAPTIAAPRVAGGGGGGGRRGGGGGAAGRAGNFFNSQELGARGSAATGGPLVGTFLRAVPTGSPTSLERTEARGDRRAREARLTAEKKARKKGKSEEEIREAGERAYINARKATIKRLRTNIRARYRKLVGKLKAKRKTRAGVKVPAKPPEQKQKALDRREKLKGDIDRILDEMETLAATDAELVVEGKELGEDLKELDRSDAGDEGDPPPGADDGGGADAPSAPTELDYLNAALAEAGLTPGVDDDIAAADALATFLGHQLNYARASGDPRRIEEAARAYQDAIDRLNQLKATRDNTAAIEANTEQIKRSFGGSNVIGYRGQDYVLGTLSPPSSDRLVGMETGL